MQLDAAPAPPVFPALRHTDWRSGCPFAWVEVTSASNQPQNHGFDAIPFMNDVAIAQPQNEVVAVDELYVAIVVPLLRLIAAVKLLAIAFDDEPIADQHVDPSDTGPMHLDPHPDSKPP